MFNRSEIMRRAWRNHQKGQPFGEAQHRAWLSEKAQPINAQRIEAAKAAAGITEEARTWAGWRDAGFMVRHGSKAMFAAELIHGSKGDGAVYRASFFSKSQVEPITVTA